MIRTAHVRLRCSVSKACCRKTCCRRSRHNSASFACCLLGGHIVFGSAPEIHPGSRMASRERPARTSGQITLAPRTSSSFGVLSRRPEAAVWNMQTDGNELNDGTESSSQEPPKDQIAKDVDPAGGSLFAAPVSGRHGCRRGTSTVSFAFRKADGFHK